MPAGKGLALIIADKEKPKPMDDEDSDMGLSEAMGHELMEAIEGKNPAALVQIIRDIAGGAGGES